MTLKALKINASSFELKCFVIRVEMLRRFLLLEFGCICPFSSLKSNIMIPHVLHCTKLKLFGTKLKY